MFSTPRAPYHVCCGVGATVPCDLWCRLLHHFLLDPFTHWIWTSISAVPRRQYWWTRTVKLQPHFINSFGRPHKRRYTANTHHKWQGFVLAVCGLRYRNDRINSSWLEAASRAKSKAKPSATRQEGLETVPSSAAVRLTGTVRARRDYW